MLVEEFTQSKFTYTHPVFPDIDKKTTWQEIEGSGLKGTKLLQKIIDNMADFPIPVALVITPGDFRLGDILHVAYDAPDAYGEWPSNRQHFSITLPSAPMFGFPEPTARQWAAWLLNLLSFIAAHEVAEFFVVSGERLFDPHDREKMVYVVDYHRMPWDF